MNCQPGPLFSCPDPKPFCQCVFLRKVKVTETVGEGEGHLTAHSNHSGCLAEG